MEVREEFKMDNQEVQAGAVAVYQGDNGEHFIADLTQRQTMFCSFNPQDPKGKAQLFKAMNNPDKRLGDCINMTILAKDLFCEVVKCVNKETGEVDQCPRIVIIDEDGVGYQAVSLGVFSAVKKLMGVFGQPTWETPIPLVIKQITKGEKKLLTLDIDEKKFK